MGLMKRIVVIIPGLGDHVTVNRLFLPFWWLVGLRPVIYRFGWDDPASSLETKLAALHSYIEQHGIEYVVGISAGGTAAVNILYTSQRIKRVATIASPLRPTPNKITPLLAESLKLEQSHLRSDPKRRQDILSLHGWYDGVVPIELSRVSGVRSMTMPSSGHAPSIFAGMVLYPWQIRKFLEARL